MYINFIQKKSHVNMSLMLYLSTYILKPFNYHRTGIPTQKSIVYLYRKVFHKDVRGGNIMPYSIGVQNISIDIFQHHHRIQVFIVGNSLCVRRRLSRLKWCSSSFLHEWKPLLCMGKMQLDTQQNQFFTCYSSCFHGN